MAIHPGLDLDLPAVRNQESCRPKKSRLLGDTHRNLVGVHNREHLEYCITNRTLLVETDGLSTFIEAHTFADVTCKLDAGAWFVAQVVCVPVALTNTLYIPRCGVYSFSFTALLAREHLCAESACLAIAMAIPSNLVPSRTL